MRRGGPVHYPGQPHHDRVMQNDQRRRQGPEGLHARVGLPWSAGFSWILSHVIWRRKAAIWVPTSPGRTMYPGIQNIRSRPLNPRIPPSVIGLARSHFRPVGLFHLRQLLVGQPVFILNSRARLGNALLNALGEILRPREKIGCRIFVFALGGDQLPPESLVQGNRYCVARHRLLVCRRRPLRAAASHERAATARRHIAARRTRGRKGSSIATGTRRMQATGDFLPKHGTGWRKYGTVCKNCGTPYAFRRHGSVPEPATDPNREA